jgi:hypothetical protein
MCSTPKKSVDGVRIDVLEDAADAFSVPFECQDQRAQRSARIGRARHDAISTYASWMARNPLPRVGDCFQALKQIGRRRKVTYDIFSHCGLGPSWRQRAHRRRTGPSRRMAALRQKWSVATISLGEPRLPSRYALAIERRGGRHGFQELIN